MANRKFTEEQIISILREAEAGAKIPELCRRYGVSDATYYRWKAKYSGHMLTLTSQLARRLPVAQHTIILKVNSSRLIYFCFSHRWADPSLSFPGSQLSG